MEQYILALDQGQRSRAIVFDRKGLIRSVAQREFTQLFPKPGWVEHNPHEIWSSQASVIAESDRRNRHQRTEHRGHRHHQPARNHDRMGCGDRRAGLQRHRLAGPPDLEYCDRLKADGKTEFIREKNGTDNRRLFQRDEDKMDSGQRRRSARTGREGQADVRHGRYVWLIWRLTRGEVHVTDVSNASRTMLFNIHTPAVGRGSCWSCSTFRLR